MLISPQRVGTQLDLFYQVLVGQIKDFNFQLDLYLGTHNYVNQNNIDIYFKDYVKQKDLTNYLLLTPTAKIALNANYTITTSQITDLSIYGMNFLTITQSSPTGLDKNYYIQLSQVRNDYLKNITSPNVNSVYFYQANSVQNQQGSTTFDLLPLHKLQSTFSLDYNNNSVQNNLKYFTMFDLSKSPSYMQIISQNDIRISSSQITDLATTFANYLPVNPALKTALNTNYTIKQSQITDLAPVDMSNYLPLNPTTQITLSSKYYLQIRNQLIILSLHRKQLINYYSIIEQQIIRQQIQKIYVRYLTESGKILQIDQTGSVCQFGQQLTMQNGSQIGTAYCYTGFGGYMFTGNSNVNNVNWQQSPSSSIQLDTSKKLNDAGCYGMHFNNLYYNQSLFMGDVGQKPWIIGCAQICCYFALNSNPSQYMIKKNLDCIQFLCYNQKASS
ncbi:hypothetical protein ABPG72_021787 [Tetrahymena utriculariae]